MMAAVCWQTSRLWLCSTQSTMPAMPVHRAILAAVLLALLLCNSAQHATLSSDPSLDTVLQVVCDGGNLKLGLQMIKRFAKGLAGKQGAVAARIGHVYSALEFIIHANVSSAVHYHLDAKLADKSVVPPLASLHLDKKECNGLGDIFYVSAVLIKQLVDTESAPEALLDAHTTMVTLCADSGLSHFAEAHLSAAMAAHGESSSSSSDDASLLVRAMLMAPAVYDNRKHIRTTRSLIQARIDDLYDRLDANNSTPRGLALSKLDEFTLSPTFYFAYMGFNDRELLTKIHDIYALLHPPLRAVEIASDSRATQQRSDKDRIHVGFVSAHFRRHSICKLYCNLIKQLDRSLLRVTVFSALQETHEDDDTRSLASSLGAGGFVRVGMTLVQNRYEVTSRAVDVLIYLDIGMTPSTPAWAGARLAPVQVVTWGHPSTSGLRHVDYFLSSDRYHSLSASAFRRTEDVYSEQLLRLEGPGFVFDMPRLDVPALHEDYDLHLATRGREYYEAILASRLVQDSSSRGQLTSLLEMKIDTDTGKGFRKIVLCPQFLPKIHPKFDKIFKFILKRIPGSVVVVLGQRKKGQWCQVLSHRWKASIGMAFLHRVIWLDSLTPQEYLTVLAIGDLMLDPYPFGGGVTALEALAVCTPVITSPSDQSVPALATGMLQSLQLEPHMEQMLLATGQEDYIVKATHLLNGREHGVNASLIQARQAICARRGEGLFGGAEAGAREVESLLRRLYNGL